ncbi:MAG: DUF3108 domain-containing protein [candidate division Zixibacteria bacterium]|nr:DUF3108 domain-containing protein [candidate division Zixibacteria bacterium]
MNRTIENKRFGFTAVIVVILIFGYFGSLQSEEDVITAEDLEDFPEDSLATIIDSSGVVFEEDDTLYNSPEWWHRKVENRAWTVGESLKFVIRYGPIRAGTGTMSVKKIVDCGGHDTYHIVTTAQSAAFFSVFFKVDDRVESYIDTEGIYTRRFEKHIREGGYKADKVTNFDQVNHLAITGKDTIKTYPFVQDILSAFYYARTQDLEVGKPLFIDNHTDRKNYPLEVKVHRKQRVKTRAGTFNCILLEPVLRSSSIFENKGRLLVWVTDDQYKMPVLMTSKVIIGHITTELEWYRLPRIPDDWTKKD